jgi:glycosyltransferase involved in cell wall biosynthesis
MPVLPQLNIGWVTTWNTRCGIATYSAHLVENMPADVTILAAKTNQHTQLDEPQAVRCWSSDVEDSLSELAESIDKYRIDTLVVQFNYSFFDLDKFGHFLNAQLDAGRIVVLMMHSTSDPVHILPHMRLEKIRKPLLRCHRILVHTPGDLNRLKALGLIENVTLFPHGIREDNSYSGVKSANIKTPKVGVFTIASYGFFLPHKGLLELIQAVALLKQSGENVRLHMINAEYPVPESTELIRKAKDRVTAMGLGDHVQITTDFLSDEESLSLLADADLIVFPYQITGESASGAVRYGLSTKAPVAVTPLPIFDDVSAVVHRLPGQTPEDIARGIRKLIDDIACNHVSIAEKDAEATHWRTVHSYKILSNRLYGMIQSLQQQRHLSVLNESTLNDI